MDTCVHHPYMERLHSESGKRHDETVRKLDAIMVCLSGDPSDENDLGIKGELRETRESTQKAVSAIGDVVKTLDVIRPKVDMHDKVILWTVKVVAAGLGLVGTITAGLAINALTCNTIGAESTYRAHNTTAVHAVTADTTQRR